MVLKYVKKILIVIASLTVIGRAELSAQAPRRELTIGTLFHLTGEFSVQGEAFKEGVDLAVRTINLGGKLHLNVVHEDTEYRPIKTVSGAKKLIERDKVDAVLISTASEIKSAGPVLNRAKRPTIVLWDSSPEIEAIGECVYAIGPWTPASGESAAQFARAHFGVKRVAVIDWNTEWSQGVSKFFRQKMTALGSEIVATISVNPDELDFRSLFQRLRERAPDLLYAPADANLPTFFRQLSQSALKIPVLTSDIITEDLLLQEPEIYENVYQSMSADLNFPATMVLRELYQQSYGRPLTQTSYVAWGYDAVMVLAEAFGQTGKLDCQSLSVVSEYHGAAGSVSFKNSRSAPRPVEIFQIRSGQFQKISKVN